jgi:hypothetical protein
VKPRRRKTDWLVFLAFLASALGSVWAWSLADNAIEEIERTQARVAMETKERRHQICLSAEREHLGNVTRLLRTYDYLQELDPQRPLSLLNKAILRQLPDVELEARTDQAPEFCDEPDLGLPEPDPLVPPRPDSIPELR